MEVQTSSEAGRSRLPAATRVRLTAAGLSSEETAAESIVPEAGRLRTGALSEAMTGEAKPGLRAAAAVKACPLREAAVGAVV